MIVGVVVEEILAALGLDDLRIELGDNTMLKIENVCWIFRVSKPTAYNWMRLGKISSFTILSRRYFIRTEIKRLVTLGRK